MSTRQTIRIFLSSTFLDFEEERRLLVQQAFPALREKLRDRLVELVDVDLRWGISASDAEQEKILPVCLDEIDQCRPYFIGLLGERYGWVPGVEEYGGSVLERHPWLQEHRGQVSVTELEIRYGVLDQPIMHDRALFFFRQPAYAERRGADFLADSNQSKQSALKDRIARLGLPVLHYERPKDLVPLLEAKLWALLDHEFPKPDKDPLESLEDSQHLGFATAKLGSRFLDAPELKRQLNELVASDHQRILISGPEGIGKSSLLADWAKSQDSTRARVFTHFVEASDDAATVVGLLQRLFGWIRIHADCQSKVPEDRSDLLTDLPHWLAIAQAHSEKTRIRWIIVLDGLDRLINAGNVLWLPTFLPASITLIISCRNGRVKSALRRRGVWEELKLQSMPVERCRAMLAQQLAVFGKELTPAQTELIVNHEQSGSPLFLCSLAEELRVYGTYHGLQDEINQLVSCEGLSALYVNKLNNLEAMHDQRFVQRALCAICLTSSGVTEQEILEFSGLSVQARWAPLRLALGNGLLYSAGRVRPANSAFRDAIRTRYYSQQSTEVALRLELANWFGQHSSDRRRAWEQPEQLARAKAYEPLLDVLSAYSVFELLHRMGGNERMHHYWHQMQQSLDINPSEHYEALWPQWRADLSPEQESSLAKRMRAFLRFCGYRGGFELQLAERYIELCHKLYGPEDIQYFWSLGLFAQSLADHNDQLDRARCLAEQACAEVERLVGPETIYFARQKLLLARICYKQRDVDAGISAARHALCLVAALKGLDDSSLIPYLDSLGRLLHLQAKARQAKDGRLRGNKAFSEAIDVQKRCLKIIKESIGPMNLHTAAVSESIGETF